MRRRRPRPRPNRRERPGRRLARQSRRHRRLWPQRPRRRPWPSPRPRRLPSDQRVLAALPLGRGAICLRRRLVARPGGRTRVRRREVRPRRRGRHVRPACRRDPRRRPGPHRRAPGARLGRQLRLPSLEPRRPAGRASDRPSRLRYVDRRRRPLARPSRRRPDQPHPLAHPPLDPRP